MDSIFRVSWEGLELEDVEAFLNAAGDEGLTWEAKGGDRPRADSVRKAVCGFANAAGGGFLIIGAARQGDNWVASSVDFQGEEPVVWLDQTIRDGVRPVPQIEIKTWPRNGGHVAAVAVPPVAVPPCMTIGGQVFERVSGRTVKLVEPSVLATLFERGQAAERQAERAALVEPRYLGVSFRGPVVHFGCGLGYAPTGRTDDLASRLFTEAFAERLAAQVDGLRGADRVGIEVTQQAVTAGTEPGHFRVAGRAAWTGGVALLFEILEPEEDRFTRMATEELQLRLRQMADAAIAIAADLGGYGRAHVALVVAASDFNLVPPPAGYRYRLPRTEVELITVQRWTDDDGRISDHLIETMIRELLRAAGAQEWEPDPV
jgi:hypothetical protein